MATDGPLYLGFDLSTQQLKALVVDSQLHLIHEAKVDFDQDFGSKYGIDKGVLVNPGEGEVFAPVSLWLDAVDLVLNRLQELRLDFSRVKGVSGAGMQHGTVFWSATAETLLENLDADRPLAQQLAPEGLTKEHTPQGAFAHPMSPNWQDASTQVQCDEFDERLGSPEELAQVTGSKAHHRFSGPQILRYRTKYPDHYAITSRISLVSSFLASIFLGRVAPIDISDVTGMNLWDVRQGKWHDDLLALAAGGKEHAPALRTKLGHVPEDGGASFGAISKYFHHRYGFAADCQVIPFTGDNPATILSLPLQDSDAMVSLGTSTTFLMSTTRYLPDPAYHFMNHPTTPGSYMFMLCYKNGGLAREHVRDALNASSPDAPAEAWTLFNTTARTTPPLAQSTPSSPIHLGLYFPRPEIVPNLPAGQWRYTFDPASNTLTPIPNSTEKPYTSTDARGIIESQMLSLRLRSQPLVLPQTHPTTHSELPPQPRRVYLVGGGSANPAIAAIAGQTLGSAHGVFRLEIGGNACGLGAAYKAVWGCERAGPEDSFASVIGKRWDEAQFVKWIAEGYDGKGLWERYGVATEAFGEMERVVVEEEAARK